MRRTLQQIFRDVYDRHFAGDERALRTAILSFAATLPQPERQILLQCELGGHSSESVGREIGLCRRQVQRYRKSVRAQFLSYVTSGITKESPLVRLPALSHRDAHLQRRAEILTQSLRGEPAKATARRLGISVRTLWRERARIRSAQEQSSDNHGRDLALNRVLGDVEQAWLRENYSGCATAANAALAIARGIEPGGSERSSLLRFRAFFWIEAIERIVGSAQLADAYFMEARKAAEECTLDARQRALWTMREVIQELRNPSGYATTYERIVEQSLPMSEHLVEIARAEIYDALGLDKELAPALQRAAAADAAEACSNVALPRIAVLELSLRPEHEHVARNCINDVRSWCAPNSRSFILAEAYETFIDGRRGRSSSAFERLRAFARHFREAKLPADTATALYLAARLAIESGDSHDPSACIEEALDAAEGRAGAKLYGELLNYAALSFGGRHRRRVADAFAEAVRTAPFYTV